MDPQLDLLPQHLVNQILVNSSLDDILQYCQSSSKTNQICLMPNFWSSLLFDKHGISSSIHPFSSIDDLVYEYVLKLTDAGFVEKGSENFINNWNELARRAGATGNHDLIEYFWRDDKCVRSCI